MATTTTVRPPEETDTMPITAPPEDVDAVLELDPYAGPEERKRLKILGTVIAVIGLVLIGYVATGPSSAERPTLEPTSTTTGKGTVPVLAGDMAPAADDVEEVVEVELIPPATTIAEDEPVAEAPAPSNVPGATAPPKTTVAPPPSTTTAPTAPPPIVTVAPVREQRELGQ
jgi:hypothetical protein